MDRIVWPNHISANYDPTKHKKSPICKNNIWDGFNFTHSWELFFVIPMCEKQWTRDSKCNNQGAKIRGGGGYFKWFIFCCNYKILAVLQIIGTIEQKNVQINSTNFLPYMGTYMSLYVKWILNNSPFPTQD